MVYIIFVECNVKTQYKYLCQ